jgi:hypothetical protein
MSGRSFTGGNGENGGEAKIRVLRFLCFLLLKYDRDRNVISAPASHVYGTTALLVVLAESGKKVGRTLRVLRFGGTTVERGASASGF